MNLTKNTLRIVTITLFALTSHLNHVCAFDLDMTVDDDIRKNYNPSKLVNDTKIEEFEQLPDLPEVLKNEKSINKNETKTVENVIPKGQLNHAQSIKLPKGSTFNVVNITKISDWQTNGATVKFKTTADIHNKKYFIPANTTFIGRITDSHPPQITCNGGLVVIRIETIQYKGHISPINGYITKADDKIIFLNNIKGDRTYLKTMWKKGNWGRSLFGRMLNLTVKLGRDGSTLILSPFPLLYGTVCFGANTLISPVTAFFSKGGHVVINSGSRFKIKLSEDAYID